ncbi:zinc finger MYM-type protein 2 [Gastrophryne carolinensis]
MATGLKNVGNAFGGPSPSNSFQGATTIVDDDDDDVVFVEPVQAAAPPAPRNTAFPAPGNENHKQHSSSKEGDSRTITETIIIDDEEEPEPSHVPDKNASTFNNRRIIDTSRPDFTPSSAFSRSKTNAGIINSGITTEPDSEIQIANVTTLDSSSVGDANVQSSEGRDMNLMITHVTSLQNPGMGEVANGLQSAAFGGHGQSFSPLITSPNKSTGPYNPGRANVGGDVFQNGESAAHHNSDAWLSQSASFPRNQQPGVDSMSPSASHPKQASQQPPSSQQPSKAVKVTCAHCKKPLQKGQTAYQRKGSTHLFCSTTCLSSFSQKPAPKKLCTMCKKDITTMKGTIVAQVDSSESFQEFCSTYCLSLYEDKQNSAKNQNKSRCTICGKLTEIRHEVSFKNMTHKLCSDHCFNRYRMANGLIMNCCEHCGEYLPSKGAGSNVLMIDGQWKRFCSPACLSDFKLKHGKLTPCTGCKAQCRIFDMTQCIGINGHMEPYCSTTCMNNHKAKFAKPAAPPPAPPVQTLLPTNPGIICHFCKRNTLPQYQATMPDGKLYNFCSSECVAKFQAITIQTSTNGQHVISDIQLKCNYCKNMFSTKPVTLDWEKKMYQFCSTICCDDYKKLHCIVTYCEFCQEEKTLHDTMKFSGIKKPFCSEGCKLLYKQDFAKRLGLKCVTCNYCFQMCKRGATKEFDGKIRDFCTEDCSRKFHDWYYKAARCDCCRTQGTLKEKIHWRGLIKNFCDQHCLLRFYSQQNEPNMATQRGPENLHLDLGFQASRPRSMGVNCSTPVQKDMKNKAVLCKPLSMTKATYCKPHMQTKTSQTEDDPNTKYVPVPVPVPVYVPVPMNLYSQKVPAPTAIPIPIPVPIFVPADWDKIKEMNEEFKVKDFFKPDVDSLKQDIDLKIDEQDIDLKMDEQDIDLKMDEQDIDLKMEDVKNELVMPEDLEDSKSLKDEEDEYKDKEQWGQDEESKSPMIKDEDMLEEEEAIKAESPKEEIDEEEIKAQSPGDEEEDEEEIKAQSPKEEEDEEIKAQSSKEEEDEEIKAQSPKEKEDEVKAESPKEETDNLLQKEDDVREDSLSSENSFPLLDIVEVADPLVEAEKTALCDSADDAEVEEFNICSVDSPASLPDVLYEPELDLEIDFPRAAAEFDTESEFPLPPVFWEEYDEQPKPKPLKKGLKKKAISDDPSLPISSECVFPFKYSYGVNAWKHWVKAVAQELDETLMMKDNLLQHTGSELNCLLSRFVEEVRRPNGDSYAPDSIYYLCLGIQEFLCIGKRTDNIFHDVEYCQFGEKLNLILKSWQPSILPDGSIFSRVEDDHLWQTNQFGTHSPRSLLFTLFYFNTKYFDLRTVDQHLRLSFGTVLKQWKFNPLTQERKACLQYQVAALCESDSEDKITPGKRKHEDDEPVFEQVENTIDPSRCPVKMFEFYLSKSPPNVNERSDVFYLTPESSSSSESLLWFTSTSLDRSTLENMLIRVLLIKDIYDKNYYEMDEDTD